MQKPEENMVNAGILFMFTLWLQGQMSDLIIFKNNPQLIADFVANPERVPDAFHKIRVKYWEKQFSSVKKEFESAFENDLSNEEKKELEAIYLIRNMIAHAHVSVARNYMLFRPHGGQKQEQSLIDAFSLNSIKDQANPMTIKLEFWRADVFKKASDLIERFDQICLKRLSTSLGVPHGRIR